MTEVWVVGYFFRQNLGDDVFEWLFLKHLRQLGVTPVLINADSLASRMPVPQNVKAIMVGGGDLINDYFLKKLQPIFTNRSCPVYAVGVGIPYPQLIEDGALDSFDYIIHRTSTEHDTLVNRYGPGHVHYSPDLAWMIPSEHPIAQQNKGIKWVGICLARPMYNSRSPEAYRSIVHGIAQFLLELATETKTVRPTCRPRKEIPAYHLEFVPFQTAEKTTQDDRIMHQDVLEHMVLLNEGKEFNNVTVLLESPVIDQIVPFFQRFSYTICSRFHAHVFSLMAQVPVLSLHCTHKVKALMIDAQMPDYELPVDTDYLYPLDCDSMQLNNRFDLILRNESKIRAQLALYAQRSRDAIKSTEIMLGNLLFYLPQPVTRFLTQKPAVQIAHALHELQSPYASQTDNAVLKRGGLQSYVSDVDRVVRMISMLTVGKPVSSYSWGLQEQLLSDDFDLAGACDWIFHHRLTHGEINEFPQWKALNITPWDQRVMDMEYVRSASEVNGKHRSGWDFTMQHLQLHHNPHAAHIFDSYLDETFGWRYDTLKDVGKIPFLQSWSGILHHTPDESHENNLVRLFAREGWQESLVYCRGLIVLSESLASWVRTHLRQLGLKIPVIVIHHPTDFDVPQWNWNRYYHNDECKLIQIGGWMRNTFAIYDFPNVVKYYGYTKCALKGNGMNHYYPTDEQYETLHQDVEHAWEKILTHSAPGNTCPCIEGQTGSANVSTGHQSPWVVGAKNASLEDLDSKYKSVQLIQHVSNDDYDKLLVENVVFLNLVDASAVNTLIECVVRNTPVLVNPLPAVVEYLGPDYPFYYTTLDEAAQKLVTPGKVFAVHEYLKHKNKDRLKVETFVTQVCEFITYCPVIPAY